MATTTRGDEGTAERDNSERAAHGCPGGPGDTTSSTHREVGR